MEDTQGQAVLNLDLAEPDHVTGGTVWPLRRLAVVDWRH